MILCKTKEKGKYKKKFFIKPINENEIMNQIGETSLKLPTYSI